MIMLPLLIGLLINLLIGTTFYFIIRFKEMKVKLVLTYDNIVINRDRCVVNKQSVVLV